MGIKFTELSGVYVETCRENIERIFGLRLAPEEIDGFIAASELKYQHRNALKELGNQFNGISEAVLVGDVMQDGENQSDIVTSGRNGADVLEGEFRAIEEGGKTVDLANDLRDGHIFGPAVDAFCMNAAISEIEDEIAERRTKVDDSLMRAERGECLGDGVSAIATGATGFRPQLNGVERLVVFDELDDLLQVARLLR